MSDDDKQHEYVPHEISPRPTMVGINGVFQRLHETEAERNNLAEAARQSRKRAVGQSRMWKTAAYLRWVDAESWRARAEVCQEERELSQQLREDDGR